LKAFTGNVQDPGGDYVARWVPEVAKLPKKWRHQPWLAPAEVQQTAGLVLGSTYPHRITKDAVMQVPYLLAGFCTDSTPLGSVLVCKVSQRRNAHSESGIAANTSNGGVHLREFLK